MDNIHTEEKQTEYSPETYRAAELFSHLPITLQDEFISLLKALSSPE